MAKGQRSNRQKALRTVRRTKVSSKWQDEAERKRYEALAKCAAAAKVEVVPSLPRGMTAEDVRMRAEAEMAVDSDDAGAGKGARKRQRRHKGSARPGAGGKAAGGVGKKSGRKQSKARAAVEASFGSKRKKFKRSKC